MSPALLPTSADLDDPLGFRDGTVLTGVSETALMTLQVRATEARRPDAILDDPMAIQLVDSIDFDAELKKLLGGDADE